MAFPFFIFPTVFRGHSGVIFRECQPFVVLKNHLISLHILTCVKRVRIRDCLSFRRGPCLLGHVIQSFLEVEHHNTFLVIKCPTIWLVLEFGILIFQVTSTWGKKWKVRGGGGLISRRPPNRTLAGDVLAMLCKHLGLTAAKKSCIDDDNVLDPADIATSIDRRPLVPAYSRRISARWPAFRACKTGHRAVHLGLVGVFGFRVSGLWGCDSPGPTLLLRLGWCFWHDLLISGVEGGESVWPPLPTCELNVC